MSDTETKRMRCSITGRVQGVGFRHFTMRTARRLNDVTGWVKNEPDGSVTLVAEGPVPELEELHGAVQEGPRAARVQSVDKTIQPATGEFNDFTVSFE